MQFLSQSKTSLIAEYAERVGESLQLRRAESAAQAARVEADRAARARTEFLATMNHELRTPLNAIIGFATMLRDGASYNLDDEQQQGYAEYILQSADLLLGHINTILEIAALDSGAVALDVRRIDLDAILDEALEAVAPRARAAGVALERRDDARAGDAWGDPDRTRQVVDHLLQIAVRSSAPGETVAVKAYANPDGWPALAVRDAGAGFAPEDIREALDALNRVERGLNRPFAGPSVGYAVAKIFVDMQGGRFSIQSRKGRGTLAAIALPPAPEAGDGQTPPPAHAGDAS